MTEMRGTFLSRRKRKKRAKTRCTDPTVAKPCKGGAVRGLAGIPRGQSPASLDGRGSSMTNHGVRLPLRTKRRRICRVHWQDPTSYFVPDGRWQPPWRPVAGSRQPRLAMMPASSSYRWLLSLSRCSAWRTSQGRGGPSAAWPAAWPAWDGGSCSHLDGWTDSLRCARRCPLCCIRLVLGIGWLVLSGWLLRVLYRRSSSLLPRGLPPLSPLVS